MRYIFICAVFCLLSAAGYSQPDIYPAPEHEGTILLRNATIHIGDGRVVENGSVLIRGSRIDAVGTAVGQPEGAKVYDLKGKHVYPGLISTVSNLGIRDVNGSVPGSDDYSELGDVNPSVRSIVAYNADNPIGNVLRGMGILLANVVPQNDRGTSQLISGTSSVVQLDAWNWEDAAYRLDGQMHFNMPSLIQRRARFSSAAQTSAGNAEKLALRKINELKAFFNEARFYLSEKAPGQKNLLFEATRGLFDKSQKLFVHCNGVKEMLLAIDFGRELGFDIVIVGGADSWQIASILKEHNIPVVLSQTHSLPMAADDDIDQPFKTPAQLQAAGVLFAINDVDATTRGRNLAFNAGTAAAYGLSKEQALSAVTLNAAKILNIADRTGSIEAGKDANIIISKGDILDMGQSIVEQAFIQGREITLDNKQSKLAERFGHRFGISLN